MYGVVNVMAQQTAQVIIDQMTAREKERIRKVEMQDQERMALISQNEEMKNVSLRHT